MDIFLYSIRIICIIGLKMIGDSLAMGLISMIMKIDLRVIYNDNGPTSQRKYAKRDLHGKVKSKKGLRGKVNMQRGAFVERSNN